jgi:hypothetical protein
MFSFSKVARDSVAAIPLQKAYTRVCTTLSAAERRATLIILVMTARRRPTIRLTRLRKTRPAGSRIVRGNHLVIIVEMRVLVFFISVRSGLGDVLGVVHGPTRIYGMRNHSARTHYAMECFRNRLR